MKMCKPLRWCFLLGVVTNASLAMGSDAPSSDASRFETVHTSNAAILNRLGLAPLQIPDGHHKKRLAGPEPPGLRPGLHPGLHPGQTRIHQGYSRRHGHRDSHVYIVKLPASPPYYTITKPHKSAKSGSNQQQQQQQPMGFQGNGKPAKVYHWNLPVVKKISEKKRLHAQMRIDQARKKFEDSKKHPESVEKNSLDGPSASEGKHDYHRAVANKLAASQPKFSASKHTRNNDKRLSYVVEKKDSKVAAMSRKSGEQQPASDKTYRLDDSNVGRIGLSNELHASRNSLPATAKLKKHRKKAAMSYYAPIPAGTTKIHKNFPGNGKPKAFYVMEKSRKPVYYHPLLP